MLAENYQGYHGLPPLVGLHTMQEAVSKGLTVAESVNRLKRYHWTAKRLSIILTSRITSMPVYELKMAFSLHAHYLAEQVEPFFNRVREMREPPYGMDDAPHEALDILLDEVRNAPTTEALVLGIYEVIIPAFVRGLERQLAETNRLFDHPTYRLCRVAHMEMLEIKEYGEQAIAALVSDAGRADTTWLALLNDCLHAMGDLDGTQPMQAVRLQRMYSAEAYQFDGVPARDERFKDLYNMGVNAEAFLLDRNRQALPKTIMLYFKRMREIDVPEMMASIIAETPGKPWAYYRDMIRQLWDEARYAMMGEVGFTSIDVDWKKIPFNFTWSYLLNTTMNSQDRHAILYFIEQGLMPAKTGKQYEWEVAVSTTNRLTQLIQDYDWADEVLHARIGRDWIVPELGGQLEAMERGNKAWSEALANSYDRFEREGLSNHDNWWPEIYQNACRFWNITPDKEVLAYNTSYRNTRADRKELSE
jgi:hypothetical protein